MVRSSEGRKVVCSMAITLDGYVVDADGSIDWGTPSREVHQLANDEAREVDVHLLGRRLFETMTFWDTVEQYPDLDFTTRDFAQIWRGMEKVVFSHTLTEVPDGYRLASGTLAEEVARLRAEPGDGVIALGGATIAQQAADLGVIEEYRLRIHPVLVGGGLSLFPHHRARDDLRLLQSRTYGDVQYVRYAVEPRR